VQYKNNKGGIFHQRLNIDEKPIVNKYCEGKLKRTLKKEFKEFEVVNLESIYYRMNSKLIINQFTSINNYLIYNKNQ